jgi:predicted RNase H-like HicB family nuclease
MNRYTYRAEWSSEHSEYVGRCLELPWLSQWAPTVQSAIASVERAVDEHLAERGEDSPPPLTERKFSGKFLVRTSPALHARLTVEAAEQNVSWGWCRSWRIGRRSVCSTSDIAGGLVSKVGLYLQKPPHLQNPAPCTSCPGVSVASPR